jgi:hypothetical protein
MSPLTGCNSVRKANPEPPPAHQSLAILSSTGSYTPNTQNQSDNAGARLPSITDNNTSPPPITKPVNEDTDIQTQISTTARPTSTHGYDGDELQHGGQPTNLIGNTISSETRLHTNEHSDFSTYRNTPTFSAQTQNHGSRRIPSSSPIAQPANTDIALSDPIGHHPAGEISCDTHPSVSPLQDNSPPKDNLPYGDPITLHKPDTAIRLYFNNGNGIRPYQDWTRFRAACHKLHEMQIDIFVIAETNLDWNTQLTSTARRICQQHYHNAIIATSSSRDHGASDFHPGGTMTAVTGKWSGRSVGSISDSHGLGRWSGVSLRCSHGHAVHILSAYRPVESHSNDTSHTFLQQHRNLLRQAGQAKPDPPKQFFTDLTTLVNTFHAQKDSVIIIMDANESLLDGKHLPRFLSQTNLISLIDSIHDAPPTYNRGRKCIDYIFGSSHLPSHILSSG